MNKIKIAFADCEIEIESSDETTEQIKKTKETRGKIMSEQTSIWTPGKSGADWRRCKRYNLTISGCTRNFECEACYSIFPKQLGINIATLPSTIHAKGFSVRTHSYSVHTVGV